MLSFPFLFIPLGKSAGELNKVTKYLNHNWEIGGYTPIAVVAINKIKAGTFLSIDYYREEKGRKRLHSILM